MKDDLNSQTEQDASTKDISASTLNAEWLANLSHELRSPLATIRGYATLLLRHEENIAPEEQHEFLQAIVDGSGRMSAVLTTMLDMAALEMGTISYHPHMLDLLNMIQMLLVSEQQKYPESTISLLQEEYVDNHGEHPVPYVVHGDSVLMQKLLTQLLDNAQKYTTTLPRITIRLSLQEVNQSIGQIPVPLRSSWLEHSRRVVHLSIRDEGIGIPASAHEHIFERFARLDLQLISPVSGMGLGLTICKYIVALHNGVLWVESVLEKGSTFHLLFPAA